NYYFIELMSSNFQPNYILERLFHSLLHDFEQGLTYFVKRKIYKKSSFISPYTTYTIYFSTQINEIKFPITIPSAVNSHSFFNNRDF
ncbi:hypothetical protein, partial [Bacillus toyonensis]|uniref:hypothetical protein n=1 Tax=Bacillus toyonensis TaxID=155322 RepID=UPI003390AAC4